MLQSWRRTGHLPCFFVPTPGDLTAQESPPPHEEPHKVSAQFPVIILPPISCMLGGVRLAVIDSDLHRGVETILNFATVCNMVKTILGGVNTCKYKSSAVFSTILRIGSARSSHHCMESDMSYFLPYPGREFLCWFAIKIISLRSDWYLEEWFKQIGQVRRIQASLQKTGDGQPSFPTLVQMRGQFSLRSVGLPCDTLILVGIMTWLIVRLLEGEHSVRFFPFNLFISASNISAPKPPKCPPNLMWRSRSYSSCLGRNRPSTTSTGGNFVLQKVP